MHNKLYPGEDEKLYVRELYAIENGGHKNITKRVKNKKSNKDRQNNKYSLRRARTPTGNQQSLTLHPATSTDATTRSMHRLVKLKVPSFVPVLVVLIKIDRD